MYTVSCSISHLFSNHSKSLEVCCSEGKHTHSRNDSLGHCFLKRTGLVHRNSLTHRGISVLSCFSQCSSSAHSSIIFTIATCCFLSCCIHVHSSHTSKKTAIVCIRSTVSSNCLVDRCSHFRSIVNCSASLTVKNKCNG